MEGTRCKERGVRTTIKGRDEESTWSAKARPLLESGGEADGGAEVARVVVAPCPRGFFHRAQGCVERSRDVSRALLCSLSPPLSICGF